MAALVEGKKGSMVPENQEAMEAMESIAKLAGAVKNAPSMVDTYEKQSEEYVEKNVKDQELTSKFWGF